MDKLGLTTALPKIKLAILLFSSIFHLYICHFCSYNRGCFRLSQGIDSLPHNTAAHDTYQKQFMQSIAILRA